MKRLVLVGALVGAVASVPAFAQATDAKKPASVFRDGRTQAGHTAPKAQPPTESATGPDGQMTLGTVHIPKAVKADGKALAAGTYQVRLTPQSRDAGREGSDRLARALGRVREGRQGRGPRSRDDHPAVRDRQGPEGHAAARQRLEGRNAQGRRLRRGSGSTRAATTTWCTSSRNTPEAGSGGRSRQEQATLLVFPARPACLQPASRPRRQTAITSNCS